MDAERERQLLADVALIKDALVGNLDGKKGALHTIETLVVEVYNPDDPSESLRSRVRRMEERERAAASERRGWTAAMAMVGGGLALLGNWFVGWLTGNKH